MVEEIREKRIDMIPDEGTENPDQIELESAINAMTEAEEIIIEF